MGRVPSNKARKHRKENYKSSRTSSNQSGNTEQATGRVCDACNNTENIHRDLGFHSKIERLQHDDSESHGYVKPAWT